MNLRLTLIAGFTLINFALFGQNFEINDETITTCSGSFQDDNGGVGDAPGAEGAPYSNTNYTYTICPDTPGDVIQVDFLAFSLYESPNPNNSDWLYIYDGDDTSANSMGSYTGDDLGGIPVTGTVNNVTGCLTFVFDPSNSSTGTFPGWEGLISCTTPCAPPTASSTIVDPIPDIDNSVSVCLNTPISFEDNGSFAEAGFTIENYIWNFDDGTIVEGANETSVTHAFSEPGEYIVTLTTVDNNGCQNLNLVPLQVLVSTIPIFFTDFTPEICLGGTGYIDGSPVQSQTWTALPPQVVAGETYLADGAGFSYTSSLVFDFFDEDQELEDINDLYDISINMEHSYMGDLQIQLTCPDGTQVILVEYPNGGGGTFLGEAVDDGSTAPGVGYDYTWDPDATNGTWGENSGGVNILPAGAYESDYDLGALVGCPLNGEWTIEVIDNLAIDNGYIFEWGINLNPELFPGITTFTPVIGLGLDSTWVQGDFMDNITADGNYADITPPDLGEYEYTFFATNNFECTFDTTIVVNVVDGPVVDAGLDLQICNDPLDLGALITSNDFEPEPCTFIFELSNNNFGFNNSGIDIFFDGVLGESITSTALNQEYEVLVPSGTVMTIEYVFSTWGEGDGNQITVYDDTGALIFESDVSPDQGVIFEETVICLGDGQLQWEWTPADGLDNPFIPNPVVDVSQTTEYTVNVYPQGFEGCLTTDVVIVSVDPAGDPGTDSTLVLCYNYGEFNLIDMLGGSPVPTGEWTNGNGDVVGGTFNTITDLGDVFTYTVANQGCINSAQVDITVIPQGDPICCEFDYDLITSDALCNASSDGSVSIVMNSSTEGGPWEIILDNGVDIFNQVADNSTSFDGLPAGVYDVSITDAGLCFTSFEVNIYEPPVVSIQAVADTTICLTGNATLEAWSTDDPNGLFSYTWIDLGQGNQTVSPAVNTTYEVFATNLNGCDSPIEEVQVSVYDPFAMTISSDTLICQNTEAVIEVLSSQGGFSAFNYSWSLNGNAIGTSSEMTVTPNVTNEYCVTLTDVCETPPLTECMTVNVQPTPVMSMYSSLTSGCEPVNVVFENQSDPTDYVNTYWDVGDGSYAPDAEISHEYLDPGVYDVTMQLESELGCFYNVTYNNYMTVYASPEPSFTWDPFVTAIPETDLTFMNLTDGIIVSNEWVFDTLNVLGTSSAVHPSFSFPFDTGGTYPTSLTVTDINGCSSTQTFDVIIDDVLNVFVPTAFSPNHDGVNDVFYVLGTDINPDRYQIQIFNRWGELVFESTDMDQVWDGSHRSGDYYVHPGVFSYRIVTYSVSTTQRLEFDGHITVVR